MNDLAERGGVYYQKFTDTPFSGDVEGQISGSILNGLRQGYWVRYHDSGQLNYKGHFKHNKKDGTWVTYFENGQLHSKGAYKDGKKEGYWVTYGNRGQLWVAGEYKNGLKVSE